MAEELTGMSGVWSDDEVDGIGLTCKGIRRLCSMSTIVETSKGVTMWADGKREIWVWTEGIWV